MGGEYTKLSKIQIDYQSTGSGTGINQISSGTVDFGASDKPMSDEELKKAQGGEILHIPTVLGAVVLTYNLPGNPELKFSPGTIAGIYLGQIKRWDDAAIKGDNPGGSARGDITVVARADGSGTSAVFTDYLSKISPSGRKGRDGDEPQLAWASAPKATRASPPPSSRPEHHRYVELIYAEQQKMPVASIRNSSGSFVKPSLDSVTAAAAAAMSSTPEDMRVSITDSAGPDAYPISSYTYILVYKDQKDAVKGKALVDFLWWALHDGTQYAREKSYAPLPAEVLKRAEAKLNSITSGGKTLRP